MQWGRPRKQRHIAESILLEAVEVMLFEAMASHKQIIDRAVEQGSSLLSDDREMDSILEELEAIGLSIRRMADFIRHEYNVRPLEVGAFPPNHSAEIISHKLYGQFADTDRAKGVILNGNREQLCLKMMLKKLDKVLSKRRTNGLFGWNNNLLDILSSGVDNDEDLMYCLYSPIEVMQEKNGVKRGYICQKCHEEWKQKFFKAMIVKDLDAPKEYFGFYAGETDLERDRNLIYYLRYGSLNFPVDRCLSF